MAGGTAYNLLIGGAIALLVFATVPLAKLAGRHGGAAAAGQSIANGVGAAVTGLVETHTRMSVTLSGGKR